MLCVGGYVLIEGVFIILMAGATMEAQYLFLVQTMSKMTELLL